MKLSWPTLVTLLVSSLLAPWLAAHGFDLSDAQQSVATAFLIGAPTGLAHWLHSLFAKNPVAPGPIAKLVVASMVVTFVTLTIGSLAACKTLPPAGTIQYTTEQAAVEAGTGILIQAGTTDPTQWTLRATAIAVAVKTIEAINTGDAVTYAQLEAKLRQAIALATPNPAYVLAADQFVTVFGAVIQTMAQTGTGPLTPAQQANINTVLDWVGQAANAYTAQARMLHAAMVRARQ
jgi:hypothetical protein